MIFTGEALTAITAPTNLMVECRNASSTLFTALEPFVRQGTDIVMTGGANAGTLNVVDYDSTSLTNAVNQWSITMAATNMGGATMNVIPTGIMYNLTASTSVTMTSAVNYGFTNSGNSILLDTNPATFGGPARVVATFTTNNTGILYIANTFTVLQPRELTDEEKAVQAKARAEYEVRMRAEEELQKIATGKAEALLRRTLSKEQILELDEKGHFHVWSKDGLKYRIGRGKSHNVKRVDPLTGEEKQSYCIYPKVSVPVPDIMLAQKLLLEADPESFLKTAYTNQLQAVINVNGIDRLQLNDPA